MTNTYPHKCRTCNSPSINRSKAVICSNAKCKTWKSLRKMASEMKKSGLTFQAPTGLTSNDPIEILCPKCNVIGRYVKTMKNRMYCSHCNNTHLYHYTTGRWYVFKNILGEKRKYTSLAWI